MYIAGYTRSNSFDGQSTNANGLYDVFITKSDSSGINQWSKTLGGIGDDYVIAITIDSNSNLYIAGYT